jgi:hypothetical protein
MSQLADRELVLYVFDQLEAIIQACFALQKSTQDSPELPHNPRLVVQRHGELTGLIRDLKGSISAKLDALLSGHLGTPLGEWGLMFLNDLEWGNEKRILVGPDEYEDELDPLIRRATSRHQKLFNLATLLRNSDAGATGREQEAAPLDPTKQPEVKPEGHHAEDAGPFAKLRSEDHKKVLSHLLAESREGRAVHKTALRRYAGFDGNDKGRRAFRELMARIGDACGNYGTGYELIGPTTAGTFTVKKLS